MESIKTLLIANRGEIATRIITTAHALSIRTIAIYTPSDATSPHVRHATTAVPLPPGSTYTTIPSILAIALQHAADAVIPGYGFLSESASFASAVTSAGLTWVGPSASSIAAFGTKHTARALAARSGVPIVPGSERLVGDAESAVEAADAVGYPVMLKATAGGGGMGMAMCRDAAAVRGAFAGVAGRGAALFGDAGVFVERCVERARHVEVQVFGNGCGTAVHFGERECSVQRRHQKVVEECPSPFVEGREGLRERLVGRAVALAEGVRYGSAGTVEFLVDDGTGEFFFLEMNTRLQVEHGITELCYGVDLVEMMLRQADAERAGKGGLDGEYLKSLQPKEGPKGAAVEARVYAENPVRDFAPSPGLLQHVEWNQLPGTRIDTWVFTGSTITPNYDPLLAKVMHHAPTRAAAISGLHTVLTTSYLHGPPTNLAFLAAILSSPPFAAGLTLTTFLSTTFPAFQPAAIDVLAGGAYTLIQDLPGRPSVGKGIPYAGPMDPLTFQLANVLAGNARTEAALEMTLAGPELRFLRDAVVALCGPRMGEATLDGAAFPAWTRVRVRAGQRLKVGGIGGGDEGGCRAYLALYGGLPGVAGYFGSKSTSPAVGIGGYQGRALAAGDLLEMASEVPFEELMTAAEGAEVQVSIPERLRPAYARDWRIKAMPGPHEDGYLLPEDVDAIYGATWTVSHNASRSGIRLLGPVPRWARADGGEGGAHPSNLVEYGYPVGALNWTGDDPCIFPVDCPNFGGFVSSTTVVRAEWWKMGQLKAGDKLRYERVSLEDALDARARLEAFLSAVEMAVKGTMGWELVEPLDTQSEAASTLKGEWGKAVLWHRPEQDNQPAVTYRQGGDDHLLIEYGHEQFDLNHRCRVTALESHIRSASSSPGWLRSHLTSTMGCCTSLLLTYDGSAIPRAQLVSYLQSAEAQLGDLRGAKLTCRRFRLPLSFESAAQRAAIARYTETQRPHAPYLPDNLAFVARNNGITSTELKRIYLRGTHVAVAVGFFCGNTVCLPADPRMRLCCPKQNPSRVHTPAGTVSWGGSCMSLYPVDSPGGYQMTGRTVPCFDALGWREGFDAARPWLYRDFDLLTYYEVGEAEMDGVLRRWEAGLYEWEWDEVTFDMAEHNALLAETAEEVRGIRARQAVAQEEMVRAERESLARWREEKKSQQVDESTVESLLDDPAITAIEAPVDANVWKVEVADGDVLKANHLISILEAMKLEISVRLPEDMVTTGGPPVRVEKVLVRPGDTVKAGGRMALVRRG